MDQIDYRIIELLQQDGRRSNVEIGKVLGVSEGTIRKHIEHLLAEGGFKVIGQAEPSLAGYNDRVIILLTMTLASVQEAVRQLRDMPEVLSVYLLTGGYDIMVEAAFSSNQHLLQFINEKLTLLPGVIASKTCHVPQIVKERSTWALPKPQAPMILIVDDDPDFVEICRMVLEAEGFTTQSAATGQVAFQMMLTEPPDLVILDIIMEGVLDGWDALRRVRDEPTLRNLPVLVVSSITSTEYAGMLPTDEDIRVDSFLSKPVSPVQLTSEVKRLLRRR
ncbi:MAG: response regulator [Chloroflexi bacterium]|nr:response regulator [Chloroflexota bacterium]